MNEHLLAAFAAAGPNTQDGAAAPPRRRMQDIDDETFAQAMLVNEFEVMRVAEQLGVSRAAVYRRIESSPAYRLASDISNDELQVLLREHAGDSTAVARRLRVSAAGLRSQFRKSPLDWH